MSKYVVRMTWADAAHLSPSDCDRMLAEFPPYQRDARAKGIPALGSGAIYPVPESDITVRDFEIPANWPRAFGMDVGWNRTAVIWAAKDPATHIVYFYDEHYQGREEPALHAQAIRARGIWIPGFIDPAARGRNQHDGQQLIQMYLDLGLKITPANHAVEAGITELWQGLVSGTLKVFSLRMQNWLAEYRRYRRDEKGHIVKANDHAQDAGRYVYMARDQMTTKPAERREPARSYGRGTNAWMG
jgi:hypothetical protein